MQHLKSAGSSLQESRILSVDMRHMKRLSNYNCLEITGRRTIFTETQMNNMEFLRFVQGIILVREACDVCFLIFIGGHMPFCGATDTLFRTSGDVSSGL